VTQYWTSQSDLKRDSTMTYRQPLGVVGGAGGEQGMQRVVGRDDEADGVDEELGGDVEEDEEEVRGAKAEHDVDLGDARLLLELVQVRVLLEL